MCNSRRRASSTDCRFVWILAVTHLYITHSSDFHKRTIVDSITFNTIVIPANVCGSEILPRRTRRVRYKRHTPGVRCSQVGKYFGGRPACEQIFNSRPPRTRRAAIYANKRKCKRGAREIKNNNIYIERRLLSRAFDRFVRSLIAQLRRTRLPGCTDVVCCRYSILSRSRTRRRCCVVVVVDVVVVVVV